MRMRAWVLSLVLWSIAGCGPGRYYTSSGARLPVVEPTGSADDYRARILELDRELAHQLGTTRADPAEPVASDRTSKAGDASLPQPTEEVQAQAPSEDEEEIVVTGSAIKRSRLSQPSSIQVLNGAREDGGGRRQRAPRCGLARELRDRICELASRICDIARANPDDGELGAKCDAAEATCRRAHREVESSC